MRRMNYTLKLSRAFSSHNVLAKEGIKPLNNKASFGIVFDIDGVLVRGSKAIPGVKDTLLKLEKSDIPFVIMTNGGGDTEKSKAESLSNVLNFNISNEQICMGHSPMQELVPKYKNDLILAVGKNEIKTKNVMTSYGFKNFVTIEQLHGQHPSIYPDLKVPKEEYYPDWHKNFAAILILIDPIYWGRELQIIMDILCAQHGKLGLLCPELEQHVPLYNSCCDFQFVGDFHLPRYGSGAFRSLLENLFYQTTGKVLKQKLYGKPHRSSYDYAEKLLKNIIEKNNKPFDLSTIYMIGDNPLTDIKGANEMKGKWRSILTKTGMFQGKENDKDYPAYSVVNDVSEAIEFIYKDQN